MNKLKIFAIAAFVPLFFACGEQDGSEAVITNNGALISPFDTLFVDFDSEIAVNELKFEGPAELVQTGNTSRLKFVGKNKTKADLPYFVQNKKQEIVLLNIRNDDDYTKEKDTFTFTTMPILDDIENQSNISKETAIDIEELGRLTAPGGVSFAGILEHKFGENSLNDIDFYKLELVGMDSITINFDILQVGTKVELVEAKGSKSWTADKRENIFGYKVSCDIHMDETKVCDKFQFYLKISDENLIASSPANPYNITIGVERK